MTFYPSDRRSISGFQSNGLQVGGASRTLQTEGPGSGFLPPVRDLGSVGLGRLASAAVMLLARAFCRNRTDGRRITNTMLYL